MDGAICPTVRTPSLYYSVNDAVLQEGGTLNPALDRDTENATLEWLFEALEQARSGGQTKLVGYLETVADEVVFEVEAARERGHKQSLHK
jgi:hypothetical protein